MEVDAEAKLVAAELEMREELGIVHRKNSAHGFQFRYDTLLDDLVNAIADLERDTLVDNW
jgi:hypothetical protein